MANLKSLISSIPDYASDIRDGLTKLVGEENKALSRKQIVGAALATAYISKRRSLISYLEGEARLNLDKKERDAVRCAAALVTVNNMYHRFLNLSADKEFAGMPTEFGNNCLKNHGINELDFEVFCLAVSIANDCQDCVKSHTKRILELGLNKKQVQVIAQITAIILSAGQVLRIEEVVSQ